MLNISTEFGADLSSRQGWAVAVCWELDGLCGWGGWAMCIAVPPACQAGAPLHQALGSKSSLCTYSCVLQHQRRITRDTACVVDHGGHRRASEGLHHKILMHEPLLPLFCSAHTEALTDVCSDCAGLGRSTASCGRDWEYAKVHLGWFTVHSMCNLGFTLRG